MHQVLSERIFDPLGMRDTGFALTLVQRRRMATMYALSEGRLRDDVMGPPALTPPEFCAGGAGLMSTADDYLQFARMLLGEDHRFFLPGSLLTGAVVMSLASLVSKTVVPGVLLPVGLVTSLIGLPIFFSLILRRRGR